MTWSLLKDALIWARQWPTPATILIGVGMLTWIFLAETGRMAKAEDLEQAKEEFTEIVNQKVAPLNAGFAVILRANIQALDKQITRLEFKRDRPPPSDWTEADEFQLRELNNQRDTQQAALDQMIESRRAN